MNCCLSSLLFNLITELCKIIFSMRNVDITWCDSVNVLIYLADVEKIDNSLTFPELVVKLFILSPSIKRYKKLPRGLSMQRLRPF